MMRQRKFFYGVFSCFAMLIIILDGQFSGASIRNGIDLCLNTVIPALFPFFILSGIINSCFLGQRSRFLLPLRKFCKIPNGSESILLIGLFAGYPIGAQLIMEAYHAGALSKENAKRMLGFCSNAGPGFIFGMLGTVFTNPLIPWLLWGIHIISAFAVGWLLPGNTHDICTLQTKEGLPISKALQNALKNIAMVCGWVILFRLLLDFCVRWFLWLIPVEIQVLLAGAIELTNGCVMLQQLGSEGIRFIFATTMLAFGGLCVAMQTVSVTKGLGTGLYFPGKFFQTLFSVTISFILYPLLFPDGSVIWRNKIFGAITVLLTGLCAYLHRRKKVVAFNGNMLYNNSNKRF